MARLVIAKNRLPYPPLTGTDAVTWNFLRALAASHDVTFVCLLASASQRRYAREFEDLGVRWVPVLMPNKKNLFARAAYKVFYTLASWLSASPRDLWYYNPPAFRRAVKEACADADLLQCEYWYLYPTARAVRGVVKVLLKHDAEFELNRRLLRLPRNPLSRLLRGWRFLQRRAYERAANRHFDHVLCLSAVDAALVAPFTKRPPRPLFPLLELPPSPPVSPAYGEKLVYFGGTRRDVNRHGLEVFLRAIYPAIQKRVPGVTFTIRGEPPPPRLRRLADASVAFAPPAEDLAEELASAAAAVVPLWAGSGVKIKILTALAHGLPVVTTPVGAEGIPAEAGTELVVAATAEAFADAAARLLTEPDYRRTLAEGARRFASRELDPAVRAGPVAELYAELASS
ncbi:MAG: glycosyltransferase [Candidatus Coatesbacteria bacterium]|nr:MAG: glycosyltransferase [Candidatus Coatesbacteria bacterium]